MFAEYRLREDAHQKALINAMSTSAMYVLAPWTVWAFLMIFEKETLSEMRMLVYILIGVFMLVAVISAIRTYQKLVGFRMFSTDQGLELNTEHNTITLQYDQIDRVERTKENVLMIYTIDSKSLPVIAISDTITNREFLEQTLQQFVTIQEQAKLPLQYNRYYRLGFSYLLVTVMLLHYASRNGNTIIASGIITLAVFAWSLLLSFRFRKQISMAKGIVITVLVALTVVARILMALYPDFLQR
jgi:hypothetical protein